jgi:hypothetical protein
MQASKALSDNAISNLAAITAAPHEAEQCNCSEMTAASTYVPL